jgi:hypothetical protein
MLLVSSHSKNKIIASMQHVIVVQAEASSSSL